MILIKKNYYPFAELLIGLGLVFGSLWFVFPLKNTAVSTLCVILLFSLLIISFFLNHEDLNDIGLTKKYFWQSLSLNFIFLSALTLVLFYIWRNSFPINDRFLSQVSFWRCLAIYPFWGFFQEYVFQAFFFRRYRGLFKNNPVAVFLSASTFSLIHAPNIPLMIFSFAAGLVFSSVFAYYPNLFSSGLLHGFFGCFLTQILLVYSQVGPHAEFGKWSKSIAPVYGSIDSIAYTGKPKNVPETAPNYFQIEIQGWVASELKIERAVLRFNGQCYQINPCMSREDVALFFHNESFRNSGFIVLASVRANNIRGDASIEALLTGDRKWRRLAITPFHMKLN